LELLAQLVSYRAAKKKRPEYLNKFLGFCNENLVNYAKVD
jgi:hypothetical protein